jgi:branched-chain amino acid transport system ATP-binding protein
MLEIKNLSVNYGGIQALQDVSLTVNEGEVVTLIGANGAGKTTTLRSISGLVSPRSGEIIYNGKNITSLRPDQIVQVGIAHSPEGRRVLARQTVLDNLELGAFVRSDRWGIKADIEKQFQIFPRLGERRDQLAGTLSGGELLLLDEPSLGLAPQIVREIFKTIVNLNQSGVTILLVEQNATLALQHANRGYVMESGVITIAGQASDLLVDERVRQAYLG